MKKIFLSKPLIVFLVLLLLVIGFSFKAVTALPPTSGARNLIITKYTVENLSLYSNIGTGHQISQPSGTTPIQGIEFTVRKAYNAEERAKLISDTTNEAGDFTEILEGPSSTATGYWYITGEASISMITNSSGVTTQSFASNGSQDGMYYVVEEPDSRVLAPATPFFVSIPMQNPLYVSGSSVPEEEHQWLYNVYVYPKNGVMNIVTTFADNTVAKSAKVGEAVDWKIVLTIPNGVGTATEFKVTDQLNSVLTYDIGTGVTIQVIDGISTGVNAPIDASEYNLSFADRSFDH